MSAPFPVDVSYINPRADREGLLELQMVILDAQDAGKEVEEIPEEFWDLVAMAGHEL